MRLSTRFSDAIHLLAFVQLSQGDKITSESIASSIHTSPVVVRRMIGNLRTAGLLASESGARNLRLAKAPKDITFLDIYLVTEGSTPLFAIDEDTDPNCIVGGNIQDILADMYNEAECAAMEKLLHMTLQEVIDRVLIADKMRKMNGNCKTANTK